MNKDKYPVINGNDLNWAEKVISHIKNGNGIAVDFTAIRSKGSPLPKTKNIKTEDLLKLINKIGEKLTKGIG